MKPAGRATVSQIITPDTIAMKDGTIVHVVGVNIPDLYSQDGTGEIAKMAKRVLSDMLIDQDVRLYQPKGRNAETINRMGHHIAHIARASDGAWVQGTMIMLGLARVQSSYMQTDMVKDMIKLEKTARHQKHGLWNFDLYKVIEVEDIPDNRPYEFMIVKGDVESIANVKNTTYINFGKNYKTDFTLVLNPKDRKRFIKAGFNPQDWGGKRLRIHGWLEYYNGPMMVIDHPEQIEFM